MINITNNPASVNLAAVRKELSLIPQVQYLQLLRGKPIIKIDSTYLFVDGSLAWNDVVPLLALLVDRAPASVLEIGTLHGHTTRLFALNLPSSTIHTIDLPPDFSRETDASPLQKDDYHLIQGRRIGMEFRNDPSISNVVQHFGDTAAWDFSKAVDASFFFIDGSHTYDYVRNDTEKAMATSQSHKQRTLLWHDCDESHPGVIRWLNELRASGFPVKRIAGSNLGVLDIGA